MHLVHPQLILVMGIRGRRAEQNRIASNCIECCIIDRQITVDKTRLNGSSVTLEQIKETRYRLIHQCPEGREVR
jgi:hypothetical protein